MLQEVFGDLSCSVAPIRFAFFLVAPLNSLPELVDFKLF